MENNIELNELRNRIAVLKQKLDNQEIVSDRMLRQTMQTRVKNGINNVEIRSIIAGIFALIMVPVMFAVNGCSLPYCAFTVLMLLFSIGATLYFNRPIRQTDLMSADLKTVAEVMARFKRRHDMWLHYVAPTLVIPWLAWTYIEYCHGSNIDPLSNKGIVMGMCLLIGAIIGGIVGYLWHRKAVNTAQAIINQIEE
ncbi:MAG: hypothetical protein HUK14_10120 [Muribaculaceae bacterium]|nr:hypothetical protein [Muribaculaceae bacterium]